MMQNNWNIFVLIICIAICIIAIRKELRRANRKHLSLRIGAVIIAAASLACIAIPISYQADVVNTNQQEGILLTKGFNPDILSSYKNNRLFTLDNHIKQTYPKAVLLDELSHLKVDSGIANLHILGNGLSEYQLSQLNHLPVTFHPQQIKEGLSSINWNSIFKTGDELQVRGSYKNPSTNKIKLLLEGLGTPLDSTFIKPGVTSTFELKNTPKVSGRAVYRLLTIVGSDTINNGSIPFQVINAEPLKVLMLTSSPDFESRFLKNWLSEKGYSVALRSAISKDKFRTEFINMPDISLENISNTVISKFDLLIGDLSALKALSSQNLSALKSPVTQNGFGLIIRADSVGGNSWLQNSFPTAISQGRDTLASPILLQENTNALAPLSAGQAYIKLQEGIQALARNTHGHTLAATALTGNGKLVYTTINNTFSWALAGNKNDYGRFWSLLIQQAARKMQPIEQWDVITTIPSVSSPVDLQLHSGSTDIAKINGVVLSPVQNTLMPFEYHYQYLPKSTGWHFNKAGNATAWCYVYADNEWQNLRKLKTQADTRNYALSTPAKPDVTKPIQKKATILVSKIYAYILLLLACTFLWAEAKMALTAATSRKGQL